MSKGYILFSHNTRNRKSIVLIHLLPIIKSLKRPLFVHAPTSSFLIEIIIKWLIIHLLFFSFYIHKLIKYNALFHKFTQLLYLMNVVTLSLLPKRNNNITIPSLENVTTPEWRVTPNTDRLYIIVLTLYRPERIVGQVPSVHLGLPLTRRIPDVSQHGKIDQCFVEQLGRPSVRVPARPGPVPVPVAGIVAIDIIVTIAIIVAIAAADMRAFRVARHYDGCGVNAKIRRWHDQRERRRNQRE